MGELRFHCVSIVALWCCLLVHELSLHVLAIWLGCHMNDCSSLAQSWAYDQTARVNLWFVLVFGVSKRFLLLHGCLPIAFANAWPFKGVVKGI